VQGEGGGDEEDLDCFLDVIGVLARGKPPEERRNLPSTGEPRS
jgi:hypothetical protein